MEGLGGVVIEFRVVTGGLFIPVHALGSDSGMEAVKLFGGTVSVVYGSGCLLPCG